MTTVEIQFPAASQVLHQRFGQGTVLLTEINTVVVRFPHGIEQVLAADLSRVMTVKEAIEDGVASPSLEVVLRVQAEAITSVNSSWGVFTRSRISLLPHQLWVCHRALKTWPVRLLIADDVGMGKTIEAGLLLWPLMANRKVQRILILCPAKLVEQWQLRLKRMFDIRAAAYHTDLDTERSDFWGIHSTVIASLPTLRANRKGRQDRLLDAPAWDMVIVDEAHHLNADEQSGKTLGFDLLEKLQRAGKVESCVLFSGTPHRGKDYGFWSLMSLVNSDIFGPNKGDAEMLKALPRFLIRNSKQNATDMKGKRLFMPIVQYPVTFSYSEPEERFYRLMSDFIVAGKAYASSLGSAEGGKVMLVLIALQKLASSSVSAVLAAMRTRKDRLRSEAQKSRIELEEMEDEGTDESDAFEDWIKDEKRIRLQLMEDEDRHLIELIKAGDAVRVETRVNRIIDVIKTTFQGQPVLLFTEYKRTQALVIGALIAEFGVGCVGFMNGDDRLDNVVLPDGTVTHLSGRREESCDAFNAGKLRFLVSTEAGGEGIDLQDRCSALIHVDLPWNPMRLHQRVGRLNRYGQKRPVHVVSLRNPDTVEAMIWTKLETKLNSIMRSLGTAMDEPEDLMQLVLGMTSQQLFNELFSGAAGLKRDRLDSWFDKATGNLGGASAVDAVRTLVGHASSFDLSDLKDVPPVDLPDLLPFFQNALSYNRRRPKVEGSSLSFKTPDEWVASHAIRRSYDDLSFDRNVSSKRDVIGVGHPVFERALQQATLISSGFAIVENLGSPILVLEVSSRVTDFSGQCRRLVAGITGSASQQRLVKDWELLTVLNQCPVRAEGHVGSASSAGSLVAEWKAAANSYAPKVVSTLGVEFDAVVLRELALLWPADPASMAA